jgi:hypothetical protein
MNESYAAVARRAASRLADLDPSLPAYTERVLAVGAEDVPIRSFDPATVIAVAGLLVSMVQTGWSIWRDIKEDRDKAAKPKPARELVARRLRLAFPDPRGVSVTDRDRMIKVVIDELEAAGGSD